MGSLRLFVTLFLLAEKPLELAKPCSESTLSKAYLVYVRLFLIFPKY